MAFTNGVMFQAARKNKGTIFFSGRKRKERAE
jgi:hypothetical protein